MQIIVHTGAHFTDDDRLIKCLLRNKDDFSKHGVAVPGPGRYRTLLRQTLSSLRNAPPQNNAREVLLDAILDHEVADRVLLSNPQFFGMAKAAVRGDRLYPAAGERINGLARLFPGDQIEMFMGICNPATFLPQVLKRSEEDSIHALLGGTDPRHLRWSDMIAEVREAAPDVPVTVWCNEDTPLIWAEIIREMAGLDHGEKIQGGFDLLREIMSPEGMKRFRAYLHEHPAMTEMHKRRVMAAFLDKFALDEVIEEEIDIPGWTADLVDEITELYEEDVFRLQRIPGVQFISP